MARLSFKEPFRVTETGLRHPKNQLVSLCELRQCPFTATHTGMKCLSFAFGRLLCSLGSFFPFQRHLPSWQHTSGGSDRECAQTTMRHRSTLQGCTALWPKRNSGEVATRLEAMLGSAQCPITPFLHSSDEMPTMLNGLLDAALCGHTILAQKCRGRKFYMTLHCGDSLLCFPTGRA